MFFSIFGVYIEGGGGGGGGWGGRVWDHNSPDVLRYEPGNGAKQVEQVEQACVVRRLEGRELYELSHNCSLSFFYCFLLAKQRTFPGSS